MGHLTHLLLLFLLYPSEAFADFSGHVISVLDGDTIEVLHNQHPERIRLSGIDCPEKGQSFGTRSKQATSALVFEKEVTVQTHEKDRHKRILGDVILLDGTNLNQELVKQGWCWWDQKAAPTDSMLKSFEQEAREARRGLWAELDPIPPWLFRRLRSGPYP
jgi:micrococcal nuclease